MKGGDASAIDGFLGPWAKYQDEKDVAKPTEVSCNNHLLQCSLEYMLKSYRINSSLFNSFFFIISFVLAGRRSRRSWMKSQQRGRRKAKMRKRLLERRRPFYMVRL